MFENGCGRRIGWIRLSLFIGLSNLRRGIDGLRRLGLKG